MLFCFGPIKSTMSSDLKQKSTLDAYMLIEVVRTFRTTPVDGNNCPVSQSHLLAWVPL